MTDQEIKLELLKATIASPKPYTEQDVKLMYAWVIETSEEKFLEETPNYDNIPVGDLLSYILSRRYGDSRYASSLEKVFQNNNINTVGDLLRFGRTEFIKLKRVGKGSVTRIDDALEELYNIKSWYKQ